ncbi:protein-disulfide reductase DsbD domain-containing protein [Paludibaculum fermentans]|uniref:protein-disulfide reductase DsbD domain-containing protein n=1 Tax=Paludibaculum fermentans TaxID=1473598 RepID=UPI003EC0B212
MNCFSRLAGIALCASFAFAQAPSTGVLTVTEPAKLIVKRTENPAFELKLSIRPGYHANSNTPTEEYLIPFKLTWEPGALEVAEIIYPKAKLEKYDFAAKPISVFGGDFSVVTKFKRAANPALGPGYITGKLRYQACNDKMCLPPKSVEIKLPILMQ